MPIAETEERTSDRPVAPPFPFDARAPEEPTPSPGDPRALAARHVELCSGTVFLPRTKVAELERAFARLRVGLSATKFDDASERTAAEWYFDNAYLVRRVLAQMRREFPSGFQRSLPRLSETETPRALEVARAILAGDGELDVESLDEFLSAYQTRTPLTIAELWALPVLLRLVVLRELVGTLERVLRPGTIDAPGTSVGRGIRALRLLADIDVKALFCRQSLIERLLAKDPAGAYALMDFDTRDDYRRVIEEIALSAAREEGLVARAALELSRDAPPDGRRDHVGHWLVGPGRPELERALRARPRGIARRIRSAPRATFFGLLVLAQLLAMGPVLAYLAWLGAPLGFAALAVVACWIPSSVPAVTFAHWLLSRLVPPHRLPKLDFSKGIPRRWRTLVAVPTLLGDDAEVDRLIEQLAIHYLANPDPELAFALLTDHVDTRERPGRVHEARLRRARRGIRRLNASYGREGQSPFHLMHRESRWNPAEKCWMGWERKRGKLEELNRYLCGDTETSYEAHEGDRGELNDVAFVLTLDSDTQLPPGAAARLVGALAHPLNRPRVEDDGRVRGGYTVIQPRVEISPRSARRSLFTLLFTGDTGIDIYTRAVSEVYQDLFGEGIYVGKGIYDVKAFGAALEDRAPENSLVSHDLFEGVHGRAALATDVVVYEDYPPHYAAYLHRMHRWVRGDWQLVPWLGPFVPNARGGVARNRLTFLDRFKIADNLRRSLFAPSVLALFSIAWFALPGHTVLWMIAGLLAPGAGALASVFRGGSVPRRDLGRWFLAVCFAVPETAIVLDAIARVFFRMFVTRRRLLEWTTAARAAQTLESGRLAYARRLWSGPAFSLAVAVILALYSPVTLVWASPLLLLWLASPEIAFRISRPLPPRAKELDPDARRYLRRVARRTWLFFETFVGPSDQWLPPDHYQEHPRAAVAHRTSPTNIGLLLLSELSAYDLGYLGVDEFATRVGNTLSTVERLERHRGHIYNWYDTRTLAPLEPRYVSTVDSGNLAGALIALAEGCERAAGEPPIRAALRDGLLDTAELLAEAVEEWASASRGSTAETALLACRALLDGLRGGDGARTLVGDFEAAREQVDAVEACILEGLRAGESMSHDPTLLRELKVWLERLEHQTDEALSLAERLVPAPLSEEPPALSAIPAACDRAREQGEGAALASATTAARALSETLCALAERSRALADEMELRFLYDEERRLFHVGYDVSADRLDPHHYDLLASEARLASFLAVMRHEVPPTHWFTLGRPLVSLARVGPTLISWGGSMFEYLMPPLLMRSQRDTLLAQACEAAIERQMEHGRQSGTPWGVSESGYAFLDGQQAYQYRSFGVPGLGLRRGLEEDPVIAPYASFLALPFRPPEVVANLRALEALGMRGLYGFFEAADFHPERSHGSRPALVRSYMAHHHGMSLVALDNHLNADVMVERFHADPRVKSVALLLDERAPRAVARERADEEGAETADVALTPEGAVEGWEPSRETMQTWALGNGTMTTLVSADGGGGLRWHDLALTRWQSDPVTETWGSWIYLVDLEDECVFGATPGPVGEWPDDGRVHFEAGLVEFNRRHEQLKLRLRVAVAAAADVEVRELQISNEGDRPRRLRVVGCTEPLLTPLREAGRHPAFSRLFLRCEPHAEISGFLVTRVVREGPPAPVLLHRMVGDEEMTPRLLEIDRGAFLGRWGSPADPAGVHRSDDDGPAHATLDPICASAAELVVDPGTSRSVILVTAVAPTRSSAMSLARRFSSPRATRWAIEDAARAAAHRVHRLGISPSLLPAAQRLLSALLASDPTFRAPPETLELGRPSQRSLWGRGISGDELILLLRGRSLERTELFDDVLAVHRYLRGLGVTLDLVLVDEAPSGYGDEGVRAWHRALTERGAQQLLHQRGGVHIVRVDQTRGEDLRDLEAAAHVVFDARSGGGLREHLDRPPARPIELPLFEPAGAPPGSPRDPDVRVKVPDTLAFDNGVGGFDGDEYVIRPGVRTPTPWCNVLASPTFGCLVSEGGLGSTWSLNAGENRLTPWRNDPVVDMPSEVLYLRDEETAQLWSTTPRPNGVPTLVRHGAGYTVYELACAGLEQRMTVFVGPEHPAKIVRLVIRNPGERARRLTATYYAEWVLGARRSETRAHIRSEVVNEESCLLAQCSWSMDFAERVAFLASDRPLHGFTTDRAEFLGRGGDLARPAALGRWGLSGRTDRAVDPCAGLQVHLDLAPGEEIETSFVLGQASDRAEALDVVRALRGPVAIEEAWQGCRAYWDGLLDAVRVRTPDASMNRLSNRWLLYQSLASRFFGRTGFHQSSGAYGFRDQLQDALAFLHVAPEMTRAHILESAAHQFVEGDVLHWWHPPGGAGVRTRCSDDLLWLVYVTAAYVDATGDDGVLGEAVPFLVGDELEPRDHARYGRFAVGAEGNLLEHCRRALTRGFTAGSRGLPLIGDGDWNDGMNRVGPEGRGESVWLGWFLYDCTTRFASLLDRAAEPEEAERWRARLAPLAAALEEHAWDGLWYRRAYCDDGTVIGSAHSPPPHIDSIAQSWAALSGAGDPARVEQALAAADRLLVLEEDRLVLLLAPPFRRAASDAGYIAAYPPGVRENGGQYTHAATWLGWAHAARGDGAAAHRVYSLLDPLAHARTPAEVERYRVEPYVIAADVYGHDPFVGRGGWTWYTGAAAWTWRLGVEAILGLRWEGGALVVDPCIPPSWEGFEAWVKRGGLTVHIVVDNPAEEGKGVAEVRLDGRRVPHARVEFEGSGERRLEVTLGRASPPALSPPSPKA